MSSKTLHALTVLAVLLATGCTRKNSAESKDEASAPVALPGAGGTGTAAVLPRTNAAPVSPPIKAPAVAPKRSLGTLRATAGLPVGASVPDATVLRVDGQTAELSALLNQGPTVLVFYRGGWCPYCNFHIRELTQAYPEFERRGVLVAAISVDRREEATKTAAAYDIPFPVLSDSELSAHQAFNVLHEVGEPELSRLQGYGIDIEAASGRGHHTIAVPSVFIIADGRVRFAHANPDYKERPSAQQLIQAIDGLGLTSTQ